MGAQQADRRGTVHLSTDRLEITPLSARDVSAFVAYRRDPRVARFQSWDLDYEETQAQKLVADQQSGALIAGRWLQLGLHERTTGQLVGDVAVYTMPHQPDSYGLGVTLAFTHQGRGLATESCNRVLDYLFSDASAHRVEATCDVRNTASRQLLRRLKMRHESRRVNADWCKGEWTSVDTFAVLAADRDTTPAASTPHLIAPGSAQPPEPRDHPLRGVSFVGIHTDAFSAMKDVYAKAYAAPLIHEASGAAWYGMGDGGELHVYDASDSYHRFFGTAPVPGFLVDNFSATELRLTQAGAEWLTPPDTANGRVWRHYRAPDGNVYELMGPQPT